MIVDTSVWIDFLDGHPSAQADALFHAIAEGDAISLPGLVLSEILLGLKNDAQARRVESLLDAFDWVEGPLTAMTTLQPQSSIANAAPRESPFVQPSIA